MATRQSLVASLDAFLQKIKGENGAKEADTKPVQKEETPKAVLYCAGNRWQQSLFSVSI